MTRRLYSYVIKNDNGSAPNPFWNLCTLTICKPDIRRTANRGDWVVGTGSKNSRLRDGNTYDFSDSVVYAMKITKKLSLEEYDQFCCASAPKKIPKWFNKDVRRRLGDCIYDYSNGPVPKIRMGVHTVDNVARDLRGRFSLISNHFYYFGEQPRALPENLKYIIRRGQKHLVFDDADTLQRFEMWISKFTKNKIYAKPQLQFEFEILDDKELVSKCSSYHIKD